MKYLGLIGNYVDAKETISDVNDKILVFDIDNTLYKETEELVRERRRAGYESLKGDLNISFDEFYRLSDEYTKEYGTNYKGFIKHFNLKPETITKINDIDGDLRSLLKPNKELIDLLKSLPFKMYCFSNANLGQTINTLRNIGLDEVIDYVFYVKYDPNEKILCKPNIRAYEVVNEVINKDKNKKVLFFDDNVKNIHFANQFGWTGILVEDNDFLCKSLKESLEEHFGYKIKEE